MVFASLFCLQISVIMSSPGPEEVEQVSAAPSVSSEETSKESATPDKPMFKIASFASASAPSQEDNSSAQDKEMSPPNGDPNGSAEDKDSEEIVEVPNNDSEQDAAPPPSAAPAFRIASFASTAEDSAASAQEEEEAMPTLEISSVSSMAVENEESASASGGLQSAAVTDVDDDDDEIQEVVEATPDIMQLDEDDEEPQEVDEEDSADSLVFGLLQAILGEVVRRGEEEREQGDEGLGGLGMIEISAVSSMAQSAETGNPCDDDDCIEILDDEPQESTEETVLAVLKAMADEAVNKSLGAKGEFPTKRPTLRLASFADLTNQDSNDSGSVSSSAAVRDEQEEDGGSDLPMCNHCKKPNLAPHANVVWETMQFCDERCLELHQRDWRRCSTCGKEVLTASMGKYCVRFGSNIRQFCSNPCLEDHKKGLKACCYCQRDIPGGEGFLAPIGGDGRGQFKDFCNQSCLRRYQVVYQGAPEEDKEMTECAVCGQLLPAAVELVCRSGAPSASKAHGFFPPVVKLCGPPCAASYKFANRMETAPCDQCAREFDVRRKRFVVYHGAAASGQRFCGEACQNVFVMRNRRITPCAWCKVKKYNFDMIERWTNEKTSFVFCSLNCLGNSRPPAALPAIIPPPLAAAASAAAPTPWRPPTVTLAPPTIPTVDDSTQVSGGGMPVIQSVSSLAGESLPPSQPDRLPLQPVPPPTQIQVCPMIFSVDLFISNCFIICRFKKSESLSRRP